MPGDRFTRFRRKGVLAENSPQSDQPEATTTPDETKRAGLRAFFGFNSTSRSPSPRPPSSASTSPRQWKYSKAPQNHDDIATVPTEAHYREQISRGPPKLSPEEGDVIATAPSGPGGQHKVKMEQGPNEQQRQAAIDPDEKGGDKDLWTKAYDKLPDEIKKQLVQDKLQTLKNVLEAAKEANIANRLKLKWGGKEIDVQESADNLVGWVTKFKEIGDIVVQYDPVHAALPWAGVRFILLVRSAPPLG